MQSFNYGSLFLAIEPITIVLYVLIAIIALCIGGLISFFITKKSVMTKYEKENGDIEKQRNRMLDDVREESRAIKKEALLEAKEQEIKLRNEFERESKEKRVELQRMENRLNQKEETLEKKEEN